MVHHMGSIRCVDRRGGGLEKRLLNGRSYAGGLLLGPLAFFMFFVSGITRLT